jgi:general secretion pathway protein F
MPVYEYTALDKRGKERKGIVNAESSRLALNKIRGQGFYPRQIEVVQSGTRERGKRTRRRLFSFTRKVSHGDLVVTMRQLSTLLSAGLPLASCLDGILQQLDKGPMHRVIAQVRERVNEGSSLAAALDEHRGVFPPTFSAMVRAGESSGTLELVLDRLAEFSEQQQALRRQIQSSLAYPILIFLVSMGVIFFLMSYVVPKVTQIFLDFEQALPLPTLALMQISSFIHAYWWLFPAVIVLGFYACRRFAATQRGRSFIHSRLLKLPVLGPLLHHVILSRFCHTLGTLLKNEVSLLQSLQIVRSVVSNTVLQQAVDSVVKEVREGSDLARPMSQRPIFPPTMVQLVAAGEQSGQLDAMFLKVAQNSEEFVTNKLAMLTSLLEPIMILVLGGFVGFVVLAVLLPIFDMSQLIQ